MAWACRTLDDFLEALQHLHRTHHQLLGSIDFTIESPAACSSLPSATANSSWKPEEVPGPLKHSTQTFTCALGCYCCVATRTNR